MVDDAILKRATRSFVIDILKYIEEHKSEEQEPFDVFWKNVTFILPSCDQETWKYVTKERFPMNHIPSLIPFERAVNHHHLIGKEIHNQVGTSNGVRELTAWHIILRVIRVLLNQQSSVEFEEIAFESVFNQMIEFFESEMVIEEIMAPLGLFIYKGNEIDLPDGWKLKLIPPEDLNYWRELEYRPHPEPFPSGVIRARWTLVKEYETKRLIIPKAEEFTPDLNQINKLKSEIGDIVSSLRLLKKGSIIQKLIQTRVKGWWGSGGSEIIRESHSRVNDIRLKLLEGDKNDFLDFHSFLSQVKREDSFRVALRRLDYITERGETSIPADKILDATIGLESLFLAGIKEELRYRLSLRVAYFLGITEDKRERIFKTVRTLYDLRSAIVHGSDESRINDALGSLNKIHNSEISEMNLEIAASIAEDVLRKSLRKFLKYVNNGMTVEKIGISLDNDILKGMPVKS